MEISKLFNRKWFLLFLFVSVIISLRFPSKINETSISFNIPLEIPRHQDDLLYQFLEDRSSSVIRTDLEYDFYRQVCPQAEAIVRSSAAQIYNEHGDFTPGILRLFFHDCFIQGCDASVLLDDSYGNANHTIERRATPNRTLRGFDKIERIKGDVEAACPGIVSCSDVLALATRDAIILAGGPFYPVFTGRRDSLQSFSSEAEAAIPRPTDNINQILNEFSLRGFNDRDTVSLLGGHNIGKVDCQFIQDRLHNFSGTGLPDPSLAIEFRNEMINTCEGSNMSGGSEGAPAPIRSRGMEDEVKVDKAISLGSSFDHHYYEGLLRGRGLLFSDQQLMENNRTANLVRAYASDDGTTFRLDFARAMLKMSNLGALTGSEGEVRTICSVPLNRS